MQIPENKNREKLGQAEPVEAIKLVEDDDLAELADSLRAFEWQKDVYEVIRDNLASGDPNLEEKGVLNLKAQLSIKREYVYNIADSVLCCGILMPLLQFMTNPTKKPELRRHAAFCVTNIAAGKEEQTTAVVDGGAIPHLIALLNEKDVRLNRQAIFALSNIAGNTDYDRQRVAEHPDFWDKIINIAKSYMSTSSDPTLRIQDISAWNLRNIIVLGGPSPQECRKGIHFFLELIMFEARSEEYGSRSMSLRYATETIAVTSRTPEGIQVIQSNCNASFPEALLSLARYAREGPCRLYCLEILWRILEYGERPFRDLTATFLSGQGLPSLTALLKRVTCYQNYDRVFVTRISLLLVWHQTQQNCDWDNSNFEYSYTSTAIADRMSTPCTREDERGIQKSWNMLQVYDKSLRTDARMLRACLSQPCSDPSFASSDEASHLEVMYRIMHNLEYIHDQWVREGAGRCFLAILARLPPETLVNLVSDTVIKSVLEMGECLQVTEQWVRENYVVKNTVELPEVENQLDVGNDKKVNQEEFIDLHVIVEPSSVVLVLSALENMLNTPCANIKHPVIAILEKIDGFNRLQSMFFQSISCSEMYEYTGPFRLVKEITEL